MRLRTELIVGAALLLLLGLGAAAIGARRAGTPDTDRRRSTFLAGPDGAMAYAQALERLGVRVERWRERPAELERSLGDSGRGHTLVAALGPTDPLSTREASELIGLSADLLLAGHGAAAAIRCLGYDVIALRNKRAALAPRSTRSVVDSSEIGDGIVTRCEGPAPVAIDTLLRARAGRPAALRLRFAGGRQAILVGDDKLFANRSLRETDAGPFALGLAVPRYRRVIIDEYHHGFGASGSLAGAVLAWSARSPWGWAVWQLSVVGLLALLASSVRFGPVRSVIERRRRSPLEHVRALATALAAARGHTVAVTLMVQGLRRRLSRAGRPVRGDPRAWLDGLSDAVRTERGRRALEVLREFTGRPVDAEGVRLAANAVEDVWEELKPS